MKKQLKRFLTHAHQSDRKDLLNKLLNHNQVIVTFINPLSYYYYDKDPGFNAILRNFTHVFGDGMLIKMSSKVFLKGDIERVSFDGNSLAPDVFSHLQKQNSKVAFIGGKPGVAEKAREILLRQYTLNVSYIHSGYFDDEKDVESIVSELIVAQIDCVIIGMGCPMQEFLVVDLLKAGFAGHLFTCGGYFDQVLESNDEKYYPNLVNSMNLRWLYRVCKEPRKMLKRYIIDYSRFYRDLFLN